MKTVSERRGAGRWEGFTSASERLGRALLCIVKNFQGAGAVPYTWLQTHAR